MLMMMQRCVAFAPNTLNSITYNPMNGQPIASHFHNGHTKKIMNTYKNTGTMGHESYDLYPSVVKYWNTSSQ